MALVIRFQRVGKPKHPHFRLVTIEKARGAAGKPVEVLGHYHPKADKVKDKLVVDQERYNYWVSKGALPSDTVGTLVTRMSKGDVAEKPKKVQKSQKVLKAEKAAAAAKAAPAAEPAAAPAAEKAA